LADITYIFVTFYRSVTQEERAQIGDLYADAAGVR
jgi:hypothetical protein